MKRCVWFAVMTMFLLQACGGSAAPPPSAAQPSAPGTIYRDPAGAFAIELPPGWSAQRSGSDDLWSTDISSEQYPAARLSLRTAPVPATGSTPAELQARMRGELAEPYFQGWLAALSEQARVEGTGQVYPTTVAGSEALRLDLTYERGDQYDPRTGYGLFVLGNANAVFISVTGNEQGMAELERIMSTLRIEPGQ